VLPPCARQALLVFDTAAAACQRAGGCAQSGLVCSAGDVCCPEGSRGCGDGRCCASALACCGRACLEAGAQCCGNTTPCPGGRVCGGMVCCREGEIAVGGRCAPPPRCGPDAVTVESLDAARAALAAGATKVTLDPGGCVYYSRTSRGGTLTHEEITFSAKPVLTWDHTGAQSTGRRDGDQDGFFEWQASITRGPTPDEVRTEVAEFSPAGHTLVRRSTYSGAADRVRAVIEEIDASGSLKVIAMFDVDPEEEATLRDRPDAGVLMPTTTYSPSSAARRLTAVAADISTPGCNDTQAAQVREALRHGMSVGLGCLKENGATELQLHMMFHYVARDIRIICGATKNPEADASLRRESWLDVTTPVIITVNTRPDKFFSRDETTRAQTMWHEMIHAQHGPHDKKLKGSGRYEELDPTEACEDLCFGSDPITKCSCARCLGTTDCDRRCQRYLDCDQFTYICPCPVGQNAFRSFETCSACLAICPSGLACFGYHTCIVRRVTGCSTYSETCPS
jgi:hypothetical protein